MTRTASADSTREKLYAAGLRRFARDGWRTARVRDIVADAGQGNDSAVNYHFGSRQGLLEEVLHRGVDAMEAERRADLERLGTAPEAEALVDAVVRPLAALLDTAEGRSFLRIAGQLGPLATVTDTLVAVPTAGTALEHEMTLLVAALTERIGARPARARLAAMIVMLTAALAARAAELDAAEPDADGGTTDPDYRDDLVRTITAGLLTPPAGH